MRDEASQIATLAANSESFSSGSNIAMSARPPSDEKMPWLLGKSLRKKKFRDESELSARETHCPVWGIAFIGSFFQTPWGPRTWNRSASIKWWLLTGNCIQFPIVARHPSCGYRCFMRASKNSEHISGWDFVPGSKIQRVVMWSITTFSLTAEAIICKFQDWNQPTLAFHWWTGE